MIQQSTAVKREWLTEVAPASEAGSLSDEAAEHFKSLCQKLSATILEQHGKALQRHGTVRMSFEFPHSWIDTVVLTSGAASNIGRMDLPVRHVRKTGGIMKHFSGISLLLTSVLAACTPALGAEKTDKEKCLRSVEHYMTPEEAGRFCNQPADCRKWWDDLSEEEQEDMQPPMWRNDPDWWMKCEHDQLWEHRKERREEYP